MLENLGTAAQSHHAASELGIEARLLLGLCLDNESLIYYKKKKQNKRFVVCIHAASCNVPRSGGTLPPLLTTDR